MYKERYERLQSLRWLDDPFGVFIRLHLQNKFGPKMQEELAALHEQRFPHRKQVNYDNLPEDQVAAIQARWQQRAQGYLGERIQELAQINSELDALAPTVALVPVAEESRLEAAAFATFRSQGLGMKKYARQSLEHSVQLLRDGDFDVRIEETAQGYELWGNAERWQLDALQRRARGGLLSWAVRCWERGVNPKVYNPFLSEEIFEKSLELWQEKAGRVQAQGQSLSTPAAAPMQEA